MDGLQLAVGVRGFVGIACEQVTLILGDEWHDSFLEILSCCSVGNMRMDVEDSNGSKWKFSSCHMAIVEILRGGASVDFGTAPRSSLFCSIWMTTISSFLPCPCTMVRGGNLVPTYFS